MTSEARKDLLRILSRLDQLEAFASETSAKSMYPDVAAQAEELTELLADMRARVEQHLYRVSGPRMDDQRTDRKGGGVVMDTWMFEVYTETNPTFEHRLVEEAKVFGGVLDYREDNESFVILTLEFTDLQKARNAAEALRQIDQDNVHIEGPVPYGSSPSN